MAEILMAQFDVYRNPSERTRRAMPWLLSVQHDGVSETSSVLVIPLATPLKLSTASRLYPTFQIQGRAFMMLTPDMASLPRSLLKTPVVSLADQRASIVAAVDILFVRS